MKKASKHTTDTDTVQFIPEGFHTVTPFLIVNGAAKLLTFIEKAFDGKSLSVMKGDDDKIMHATVRIGDSIIMVSDANDAYPAMSCMLYLYVEDVDAVYQKALDAYGTSLRQPTDEFYGDRSAGIRDEWGNQWWIATHIEDVSEEEVKKRQEKMMSGN